MFGEGDQSGAAVLCSPSRLGGMQGREISPPALDLVSRFRVYWERVAALKGTCLAHVTSRPWWAWVWDARLGDPVVVLHHMES